MIRWIILLIVLCAGAVAAGWVGHSPGIVTIDWQDYRIETSFAVLLIAALVLAAVVALFFRLWLGLRRVPTSINRARRERRERLGFEALSRGLVAVAAGDAEGAGRQAKKAEALLEDRTLTTLLSAQAAQLEGDDLAATKYFTQLREQPETEFLGVRGLLTQALKRQDWSAALDLAKRAQRLSPGSPWVMSALLDVQKRMGLWLDAEATLEQSVKLKHASLDTVARQRAELFYGKSLESSGDDAQHWAKKAFDADAGFPPAAARYARLLVAAGKHRRAVGIIEDAWTVKPDPELADVYWQARHCDDALKKVQAAQQLAARRPDDVESRLIIAQAALEARLWGEARGALETLANTAEPSPRVCRLMAELEEGEHGDLARARTWLMRATETPISAKGESSASSGPAVGTPLAAPTA